MKKYFVSWIFMMSCLCMLQAQNQIRGTVSDSDNLPMMGTNVYIPELNKGTVVNTQGYYELNDLPSGEIKLQYSFLGYRTEIKTLLLNGNSITENVIMEESAIESEEIVISGAYNASQHENAVKIDILKPAERMLLPSPNFTESLTQIPGVEMISKGPGVSKPVIRGLSMDNILVLNNGVRNENYQYSDHHPLGVSEHGMGDIEIIKGPASLLYGSDAIGGVINIKKEAPAPAGSLQGKYGLKLFSNTLGISTNLGVKGATSKAFGGISAGLNSHSDFLQGGAEFVPNSRFNEYSVKANGGISNKYGVFKLYYDYTQQKLGLTEEDAVDQIADRGRKNEIWYQEFNNHLFSSQNNLFLGSYKLALNGSYQSVGLTHFTEEGLQEIAMHLNTLTFGSKLYFPSAKNSDYILGVQGFEQKNANIAGAEEILLPDARTGNYSVFGLVQYLFVSKLRIHAGVRYDNKRIKTQAVGNMGEEDHRESVDNHYNTLSSSLGGTFSYSEQLLFRTNFAVAFRTPNIAELTSKGKHELRYEIGNPDLVPQNAYEGDISGHYHTGNFSFDAAAFYNYIRNYIFIQPTSDSLESGEQIYRYMQTDARLYGGEAGIHFHPQAVKWLHLKGSYAAVTGRKTNGENLPYIPARKILLELRLEKDKIFFMQDAYINLHSAFVFAQNNASPNEDQTSGYSLFDLTAGTNIKVGSQFMHLGLTVKNLFDKKYIDHLSTLKENGFYNPGRNFILLIKIPFGTN